MFSVCAQISRTQAETQQQAIIIKAEVAGCRRCAQILLFSLTCAAAVILVVACIQGEAKALDILAKAQAARIRELDAAMVTR